MNYLFWNVNKQVNSVEQIIIDIIDTHKIDIVILAEMDSVILLEKICEKLSKEKGKAFYLNGLAPADKDRIKIISAYKNDEAEVVCHKNNYVIVKVNNENIGGQLLGVVHLPSKMYGDGDASFLARELMKDIERYEDEFSLYNSILIGDFNLNPFETAMYSFDGLNAVSCLNIAKKGKRKIKGIEKRFFFNPMWSYMGEFSNAKGTYYYENGSVDTLFWNTFDQILLRPELLNLITKDSVKVLHEVNGVSLVDEVGKPIISDHLPIICKLEREN